MRRITDKFKNASPAAKASMALLFANLVLKGLSLVSGPIFTRIMTTEQYGIVSTFQSWQSLLAVIITLNLSSGVFNNGMLDFKEKRDEFQLSLLVISSLSCVLFYIVFWIFNQPLMQLFELPVILIHLMFVYFLFVPAYWYWSGRQRYEYKYKALSAITIGSATISLMVGVIAVLASPTETDAIVRVFALEGISVLIGLFFYIYTWIKARFKVNFKYCVYALKFNIPLLPHYMSIYILSSSDRIMITKMINTSATAIYSVAYTVASVITIFWQSIDASLSPWIYERLDKNEDDAVRKLTVQIMLIFSVICVGCTLFAPEIMAVLAPSSYSSGIYVIPSVAAGVFFTGLYSLYMRIELFYKETGFATVASTLAAVSNVILNYIFIRIYGSVAAGYTTMTCYALLALFHYINVRKRGYAYVLNNKVLGMISATVIILSVAVTVLYSHTMLRYLFILAVLGVVVAKRKYFMSVLSKKK